MSVRLKTCCKCKEILPLESFPVHRSRKDGRGTACRPCQTEYSKSWHDRNKEHRRKWMNAYQKKNRHRFPYNDPKAKQERERLKRYGLTPESFAAMEKRAGFACQICRKKKRLVVDHCHKTGRVRGLLCYSCNQALGFLGDDLEGLTRAMKYLKDEASESKSHGLSNIMGGGLCTGGFH